MAKAANEMVYVCEGHLAYLKGDIEVIAGRMAKTRVRVSDPARESFFKRTFEAVSDAMSKAADAELSARSGK